MVEIGSVLRTARERRGLERVDAERELHIRERYLAALEEERFDRLPGRAYARGFLRSYAAFLGLDGKRLLDALDDRLGEADLGPVPPPLPGPARLAQRRLLALAAGALALGIAGLLVSRLAGGGHAAHVGPAHRSVAAQARPAGAPTERRSGSAATSVAHVLLRARGRCWLSVRVDSAAGPSLYQGVLGAGGVLRYTLAPRRPRLWVRVGAPWNLELTFDHEPARLSLSAPGNLVLTRAGLHRG